VKLMRRVLEHATDQSSLVLDFFAGTGTMAQAVLELNAEDGGSRRFIAVQLPQRCGPRSAAAAAGFATIADIGKERIRRAASAVHNQAVHNQAVHTQAADNQARDSDTAAGFRVLRVDSTNMADVRRTAASLRQDELPGLTGSVKPDRAPVDLLFEVMLNCGLAPSAAIAAERIDGRQVFVVDGGALIACFEKDISLSVAQAVAHRAPPRAVFLDAGFVTDADRVNAEECFARLSPGTAVRAI
jgi:adenine-specific DNA-methyltransferase